MMIVMPIILNHKNLLSYLRELNVLPEMREQNISVDLMLSKRFKWILGWGNTSIIVKQGAIYKEYYSEALVSNEYIKSKLITDSCNLAVSMIHYSKDDSIIIYVCPPKHSILGSHSSSHKLLLSIEVAAQIGKSLRNLHKVDVAPARSLGLCTQILPYKDYLLSEVTPQTGLHSPVEILAFLRSYQEDHEFIDDVSALIGNDSHECIIHGSPKFRNIIINTSTLDTDSSNKKDLALKLIDWEMCCWGDPSYDLGSIISDYLLLWLKSIRFRSKAEIPQSLKTAGIPLDQIHAPINELVRSYLHDAVKSEEQHSNFIRKAIKYAGLCLICNILQSIENEWGFTNSDVCTLQIARSLICKTENSFTSIFGCSEEQLCNQLVRNEEKDHFSLAS
jgi:thiamine kinase-like enzyme